MLMQQMQGRSTWQHVATFSGAASPMLVQHLAAGEPAALPGDAKAYCSCEHSTEPHRGFGCIGHVQTPGRKPPGKPIEHNRTPTRRFAPARGVGERGQPTTTTTRRRLTTTTTTTTTAGQTASSELLQRNAQPLKSPPRARGLGGSRAPSKIEAITGEAESWRQSIFQSREPRDCEVRGRCPARAEVRK